MPFQGKSQLSLSLHAERTQSCWCFETLATAVTALTDVKRSVVFLAMNLFGGEPDEVAFSMGYTDIRLSQL